MSNLNGMNGSGKNGKDDDKNIVSFPSAKQRQKLKKDEEAQIRLQYKQRQNAEKAAKKAQTPPFFNFGIIPAFTKSFIITMIAVHLILYLGLSDSQRLEIIFNYGFMPASYTTNPYDIGLSKFIAPLTSIFIHGGWFHLFMNVAMGLVFSMSFERTYGARTTLTFFFLCSFAGLLTCFALDWNRVNPVVGASGGISGLFACILITMLNQIQNQPQIYSSRAIVSGQQALQQRASSFMKQKGPWPIIIFWGVFMTLLGMLGGGIAWSVHLGGYAAGVALTMLLQKGKIRL